MKSYKIAVSYDMSDYISTHRECVDILHTDFSDVAVIIISLDDIQNGKLNLIEKNGFEQPIFAVINKDEVIPANIINRLTGVIDLNKKNSELYNKQLETAALKYEESLLPPFFGSLKKYVEQGNSAFDCPGHQGGEFFRRHPLGNQFVEYFGENLFRSDLCNADVSMGDLLIHEGAPCAAQQHAAKVFNADKTYFVLNGTSSSNKVVLNALLAPDDLVLFDRNNHKSNHHGALIQAGATPVYLEAARNPFGFIGGIDAHCFEEKYLRELIKEVAPTRANEKRPFRLAVIQLGTYDGTIYNA
ncbi:MAG: Orn/Lys/Arg decarboxylase N-terminal domain-containing protein, partial [Proteus mirabilis]